MTKKQSAIAASVKVASRGQAAFVFASSTDKMPQTAADLTAALGSAKYAKFDCTACGTAVISRADTDPFCITCGAGEGHVHQKETDVKATVTAESDLVALNCTQCQASTIVEAAVATAITASSKSGSTPIHCSCCGNPLTVTAEAEARDPNKLGDAGQPATNLQTPGPALTPTVAGEMDGEDDLDLDDLDDLDSLDNLDDGDDDDDDLMDDDEDPVSVVSDPSTLGTPGGAVPPETFAAPVPEDDLGEDVLEVEPFSIEMETAPPPADYDGDGDTDFDESMDALALPGEESTPVIQNEEEGDPLVDALSMDDTEMALAFVMASGRLVAMKGHVAVASMGAKSKSVNAGLIKSPALLAAATASVAAEGLRAGLQSVGFSLIRVPLTSKATVERRVQEVTAKAASNEAAKAKVFAESFALAAAGLNRGQWKGVANPMRAALETELTRVGVENPRRVVSSVFEAAGFPYAEALLSTANRLTKMGASARKELTEVLNMTSNVSPEDELDDAASNPEAAPVESRFATGGKKTAAVQLRPRIEASAGATTGAQAILAGNAPLNFSF